MPMPERLWVRGVERIVGNHLSIVAPLHGGTEYVQAEVLEPRIRADERARIVDQPEFRDFALGVVLEAQHQQARWAETDPHKADFDWHAVATYLAAKALLNPPQNDGTTGKAARLHRIVALAALCANWHAATLATEGE